MRGASDHKVGSALVLASAAGFATLVVLGKLAYEAGAAVLPLLAVRFALAAVLLGALLALRKRPLDRRAILGGLVLGAVVYAAEAGLAFAALERLDASLTELLLYSYPAMVAVAAAALGRERIDRDTALALVAATVGVALVLVGGGVADFDLLGAGLALGAAVGYATYTLLTDKAMGASGDALSFALGVTTGAALTFGTAALATGQAAGVAGWSPGAWAAAAALALLATVVPIGAYAGGIRRIGPSVAAILSTVEPPIAVALAGLVLGEHLLPGQWAGAALVLAAVVALQRPRVASSRRAAHAARAAAARPPVQVPA